VEAGILHAGVIKDLTEYVIVLRVPPPDWNMSDQIFNPYGLVRPYLKYCKRGLKPDDYLIDDLHWFYRHDPMKRGQWTFEIFTSVGQYLKYVELVHTWR